MSARDATAKTAQNARLASTSPNLEVRVLQQHCSIFFSFKVILTSSIFIICLYISFLFAISRQRTKETGLPLSRLHLEKSRRETWWRCWSWWRNPTNAENSGYTFRSGTWQATSRRCNSIVGGYIDTHD